MTLLRSTAEIHSGDAARLNARPKFNAPLKENPCTQLFLQRVETQKRSVPPRLPPSGFELAVAQKTPSSTSQDGVFVCARRPQNSSRRRLCPRSGGPIPGSPSFGIQDVAKRASQWGFKIRRPVYHWEICSKEQTIHQLLVLNTIMPSLPAGQTLSAAREAGETCLSTKCTERLLAVVCSSTRIN